MVLRDAKSGYYSESFYSVVVVVMLAHYKQNPKHLGNLK